MDLTEIRKGIDAADAKLLEAFLERMRLSETVLEAKRKAGLPILNREREREILARVMRESGELAPYAHKLYTTLFELSRTYQAALGAKASSLAHSIESGLVPDGTPLPDRGSVACQGVDGAYSQMAAEKLFPMGTITFFKTFDAVFDAVQSGLCTYGVLPIENSTNGSVRNVYTLLKTHSVSIIRSLRLCVTHNLLVKPGTKLSEITEIRSHEQALGQCSAFLKSLRGVKTVPVANTAMAAQSVAESADRGLACIASSGCAEIYGLEALDVKLQNSDNNYTRFIVITKTPAVYPGANRIAIILSLAHKPGSLSEALAKIASAGINLVKLESYPLVGHDFEFLFFFEIEASVREAKTLGVLNELKACSTSFTYLGNYVEG